MPSQPLPSHARRDDVRLDQQLDEIASHIKDLKVGGTFKRVPINPRQVDKLRQANVRTDVWATASATEPAIIRLGATADTQAVHVQCPLTAPMPPDLSPDGLKGVLALATFLPESGFALDPRERVCWNVYREFRDAEASEVRHYLSEVLALRQRFSPALLTQLQQLGFSTDLSQEADLLNVGDTPITLTPAAMITATRGFVRSLVVGLALGAGSAVIAGATGGVGTVVGVVGEAAYGAALS